METSQEDRELKKARNKHIMNVILFSIWTFGTGAVTWTGGVAQERLKHQEALITALYEQSLAKDKLYGLVDRAKAETVATCITLKGKNCEQTIP